MKEWAGQRRQWVVIPSQWRQGSPERLPLKSRKVGTKYMFPELLIIKKDRKWRDYVKSCACSMLAIYVTILENWGWIWSASFYLPSYTFCVSHGTVSLNLQDWGSHSVSWSLQGYRAMASWCSKPSSSKSWKSSCEADSFPQTWGRTWLCAGSGVLYRELTSLGNCLHCWCWLGVRFSAPGPPSALPHPTLLC